MTTAEFRAALMDDAPRHIIDLPAAWEPEPVDTRTAAARGIATALMALGLGTACVTVATGLAFLVWGLG